MPKGACELILGFPASLSQTRHFVHLARAVTPSLPPPLLSLSFATAVMSREPWVDHNANGKRPMEQGSASQAEMRYEAELRTTGIS